MAEIYCPEMQPADLVSAMQKSMKQAALHSPSADPPESQTMKQIEQESISASSFELPRLVLQPEFCSAKDNRYRLVDLLQYHGQDFVENAYQAILHRRADPIGLRQQLASLRSGRFDQIDVLASLRFSHEGTQQGVVIEGLKPRAWARKLGRLPLLGYCLRLTVALARLPTTLRRLQQLEEQCSAQSQIIADHINVSNNQTTRYLRQLSDHEAKNSVALDQLREALVQEQQSTLR